MPCEAEAERRGRLAGPESVEIMRRGRRKDAGPGEGARFRGGRVYVTQPCDVSLKEKAFKFSSF